MDYQERGRLRSGEFGYKDKEENPRVRKGNISRGQVLLADYRKRPRTAKGTM